MKGKKNLKQFLSTKILEILEDKLEACQSAFIELLEIESSYINYESVEFDKLKVIVYALQNQDQATLNQYQANYGIDPRLFQRSQVFEAINKSFQDSNEEFKIENNDQDQEETIEWVVSKKIDLHTDLTDTDKEKIMVMKRVTHCYFIILKNKYKFDVPKYIYHFMINKMLQCFSKSLRMSLESDGLDLIELTSDDIAIVRKREHALNALKNLKIAKKTIRKLGKYNLPVIDDY